MLKLAGNIPNLDLVNINSKLSQICSQDIELKQSFDKNQGLYNCVVYL